MKSYLMSLRGKSPAHKKRFSFLVAGGTTLIIFVLWATVKFGGGNNIVAETTGPVNLAAVSESGITPFENILSGIRQSWNSFINIGRNGGQ
ncbi:hypothetical protein KW796_00285 [Candidatus Parcubacteria bacterium]|nr:hypothetical protein [Candidatus Parcubacteria bacterium]